MTSTMTSPRRAMVLAAGMGTRMRPLTDTMPKPLVKVDGKPLLDHVLDRLAAEGVERAVVNVHHFAEQIIAHLADRLRGEGPIVAKWPTEDRPLTRAERVELQLWLIERGFYAGAADGILGSRTVEAIKSFQSASGLSVDGYPSSRLLAALRQ